ncbi:hypothetical protein [Pulveribacter sp.]|uniref:hypothetical protein n=1 Tax=Pulveribacter sp. TaxID=2678893 RepID=UPI0028A8E725|nr:hypothetical protein [Pulveribacter sp.]
MTHDIEDPQEPDVPDTFRGPAQALLQASLERALTEDELRQLRAAAQADPAIADDCAIFGLLAALRLEDRMARHEAPAWQEFQTLARHHAAKPRAAAPAASAGWRKWLAWWRPLAMPVGALATVVLVVQASALIWLTQRPIQEEAMRGVGAKAVCPSVMVRFAPHATAGDLTRVLTQAQAHVVDGPDGEGAYRIVGPGNFTEDAEALFGSLAQDVRIAPGCRP